MDSSAAASSKFLFIFLGLPYIFVVCSSGSFLSDLKDIMQKQQPKMQYSKKLSPHRRELMIHYSTKDDFMNPPLTNPTTPVTNPVTTPSTGTGTGTGIAPPDPSGPPMIAIPSANPMPPATDPTNPPFPVTFPGGGPPATTTPTNPANPGGGGVVPVVGPPATTTPTNPANPGGGGVVPVVGPPAVGNAPAGAGQSWCVARGGLPETTLQVALDYACGIGGADCSAIQQGQSCYNPNSLQNHASFAFNSYYQKNPVPTSCDFGGAAMVTNANPSSGSCIFPTGSGSGSGSSVSPTTVSPTTPTTPMPTPATDPLYGGAPAGLGSPPTGLNPPSNPAFGGGIGGYGDQITPPTASISSAHVTTGSLKPFIVVALSVVTGSILRGFN